MKNLSNILGKLGVSLAILLIVAFGFIAIRGILDPTVASARFGMGTDDPAGILFYRVYLSRNLVIVLAGIAFIIQRMWRPIATLLTCAIALPVFDICILLSEKGTDAPLRFHIIAAVVVTITAACLWLKVADDSKKTARETGIPELV